MEAAQEVDKAGAVAGEVMEATMAEGVNSRRAERAAAAVASNHLGEPEGVAEKVGSVEVPLAARARLHSQRRRSAPWSQRRWLHSQALAAISDPSAQT
jgi:hypothetical protein